MNLEVQFAALTDVGRKREDNEDNYLVDKSLGLYVVCDGMGGHAAGEVASAIAVRTFHEVIKTESKLLQEYSEKDSNSSALLKKEVQSLLELAVNSASAAVHAEAQKDEAKRGMGTTLVALLLIKHTAFIIYVGDSRLYLARDEKLQQVTEDHNVYNELLKRKKMTRSQIEELPHKMAITRAVGVYEFAEPETIILDLIAGDRILLCSDGLYQYFEDTPDQLLTKMDADEINTSIKEFINEANEAGGSDNITGVLVAVGMHKNRDLERARRIQMKGEVLSRLHLFQPLSERELLRVLQVTDVQSYESGQWLMKQGDSGEELFIVLEGQLQVIRNGQELSTLTQGDHVGEMALIRHQPRSASVRAIDKADVMVIRRHEFFELLRNEHELAVKLLWQFLGVVSERLAQTSRKLGQAREELAIDDLTAELFDDARARGDDEGN